jgi:hypothetical protein
MITTVIIVDVAVDVTSLALSCVTVIVAPKLLLEHRVQLHQLLSLLLELSL